MLVIWNPNAGTVNVANEIYETLRKQPEVEVRQTATPEEAIEITARRIEQGETSIVAAGGDGTINAVINGMIQIPNQAVLGVLPLGTANDWCSSLGTPDDLGEALRLIEKGTSVALDVVEIKTSSTHKYFANIATGGNSHRVTESITPEMKETWGALCYLRGTIDILTDLKTFNTGISFDGQPAENFEVWNIIVANGRTSGGRLNVAPKASLTDGLMDVVIIRDGTLLDLASMTFELLTSQAYIDSDQVEYRQARVIEINSQPKLLFSIDGDLVDEQPVQFTCCPNAVNVIVGPGFPLSQA